MMSNDKINALECLNMVKVELEKKGFKVDPTIIDHIHPRMYTMLNIQHLGDMFLILVDPLNHYMLKLAYHPIIGRDRTYWFPFAEYHRIVEYVGNFKKWSSQK